MSLCCEPSVNSSGHWDGPLCELCSLYDHAAPPSGCGRISASYWSAGQVTHPQSFLHISDLTCSTWVFIFFFYFWSHSSGTSDVFVEPESIEDKENDHPNDAEGQTSRLWVDRFSPRHYTELLSDDVRFQRYFTDISITACKLNDKSKIILHWCHFCITLLL